VASPSCFLPRSAVHGPDERLVWPAHRLDGDAREGRRAPRPRKPAEVRLEVHIKYVPAPWLSARASMRTGKRAWTISAARAASSRKLPTSDGSSTVSSPGGRAARCPACVPRDVPVVGRCSLGWSCRDTRRVGGASTLASIPGRYSSTSSGSASCARRSSTMPRVSARATNRPRRPTQRLHDYRKRPSRKDRRDGAARDAHAPRDVQRGRRQQVPVTPFISKPLATERMLAHDAHTPQELGDGMRWAGVRVQEQHLGPARCAALDSFLVVTERPCRVQARIRHARRDEWHACTLEPCTNIGAWATPCARRCLLLHYTRIATGRSGSSGATKQPRASWQASSRGRHLLMILCAGLLGGYQACSCYRKSGPLLVRNA